MKFTCIPNLSKQGGGVVWDKDANKPLAEFDSNGLFETEDEAVASKLKAMGYTEIAEPTDVPETTESETPQKTKRGRKNTPETESE